MQQEVKVLRMNKVNLGKTKAFFTVAVGDFEIEGMKLIEGKNGFFVGWPSRSFNSKKDGTTKYIEVVHTTNKAIYGAIVEAAVAEFERGGSLATKTSTADLSLDEDDDSELPF